MGKYGSFVGLDHCNHVEFGNFEKSYIIRFDNEDKDIFNWYDVNAHFDVLCKHKTIKSETVNYMCNKAQRFKCKNVVDKYSKGETYIPFKVAIGFQEKSRDRTISLRYLDHNNETGIIDKFNRYSPLYIYPCQIFSKYGTQVALNLQFSGGSKNKIIWQI